MTSSSGLRRPGGQWEPKSEIVTAKDIVQSTLPSIYINLKNLPEPSIPAMKGFSQKWRHKTLPWMNFETVIQKILQENPLDDKVPIRSRLTNGGLRREHVYQIGQEKGAEASFDQEVNVEVALALKASRRLDVRVGDFLAARPFTGDKSEKKREPDFATFRHKEGKSLDTEILMVGEAKNTALHRDEPRFIDISFLTMMRDRTTPDPDNQTYVPLCEKERWFLQVVCYMIDLNLEYGYVTTYLHTVFLRIVQHLSPRKEKSYTVYYSPAFSHDGSDGSIVTVREAMSVLVGLASKSKGIPVYEVKEEPPQSPKQKKSSHRMITRSQSSDEQAASHYL